MPTRLRKALGVAVLLTYLALYIALIAVLADRFIMTAPWWGQLAFFAAAGIVWVAPLKPLFGWMNGGG